MSMSEFDEQLKAWRDEQSSLSAQGPDLPADFSAEDIAFAQELDTLFAVHQEELPPYFVQTLLDAEEPRFQPVEHGFEYKTRARVFRRLKLRRCLFRSDARVFSWLPRVKPTRQSLIMGAMLALFMFLTVMFTAPSFASGITLLLRGAKSGVMLVHNYPTGVHGTHHAKNKANDTPHDPPKLSLWSAQQQLHTWNMYWPQTLPNNYTLEDTYLYQEQQQNWADGPFIELDYSLSGVTPHGTGQLAIREFKLKPDVSVLQVVKDGAAQGIKVDANGHAQAIYVDGRWVLRNKVFPVWVYGQRSELIYQRDGIVFWIVGDQRDGLNKDALLKIANSLQVLHVNPYVGLRTEENEKTVTLLNGEVNGPFTGDILAIYPDDSRVGPYLSLVDTQQSSPSKSVSKVSHSH